MPNDRWAPELNEPPRPRADPYDLWKEGGSMLAGFIFWMLTGVVGLVVGFAFGYAAGTVFG